MQDDDRCEEWERHEALHEDVTSQERCKERLFEEEIELKWEKGGSGLVFYTDAQYWQEEEGGGPMELSFTLCNCGQWVQRKSHTHTPTYKYTLSHT